MRETERKSDWRETVRSKQRREEKREEKRKKGKKERREKERKKRRRNGGREREREKRSWPASVVARPARGRQRRPWGGLEEWWGGWLKVVMKKLMGMCCC